ncbi:MAG: hypothetical protein V4773_01280 [Verrucomicrobiota bacterium]
MNKGSKKAMEPMPIPRHVHGSSLTFVKMLIGISIFFACLAAIFGVIAVHECGHYLAGAAGGIPWSAMKIRLFTFPQHVALKSEGRWLHPSRDYERYVAASMSLLKDRTRAGFYVSGGLLSQTLAFVGLVFALAGAGIPRFWVTPIVCALVSVPCLYLGFDLLFTRLAGRPCGDFSFLWKISPVASFALTSFVLGFHGGVLVYLLKCA